MPCPIGHMTLFQRGYQVEIMLQRRLASIQHRINVVLPTAFEQEKTTSLERCFNVMLETMLKSS